MGEKSSAGAVEADGGTAARTVGPSSTDSRGSDNSMSEIAGDRQVTRQRSKQEQRQRHEPGSISRRRVVTGQEARQDPGDREDRRGLQQHADHPGQVTITRAKL